MTIEFDVDLGSFTETTTYYSNTNGVVVVIVVVVLYIDKKRHRQFTIYYLTALKKINCDHLHIILPNYKCGLVQCFWLTGFIQFEPIICGIYDSSWTIPSLPVFGHGKPVNGHFIAAIGDNRLHRLPWEKIQLWHHSLLASQQFICVCLSKISKIRSENPFVHWRALLENVSPGSDNDAVSNID